MAQTKKDNAKMELPLQIARQYPAPLDKNSVFYSLEEAEDYAKNSPISYVGQLISVVDETDKKVEIYKLNRDGDLGAIADAADCVKKWGDTMTGGLTAPILNGGQVQEDGKRVYSPNNPPTLYIHSVAAGVGTSSSFGINLFLTKGDEIKTGTELRKIMCSNTASICPTFSCFPLEGGLWPVRVTAHSTYFEVCVFSRFNPNTGEVEVRTQQVLASSLAVVDTVLPLNVY